MSGKRSNEISRVSDVAQIPVVIYNQHGVKVYEGMIQQRSPGVMSMKLEFPKPWASGLYILKAGPTQQLTRKISVY